MAQQTINIGASPNDGTGTPLRTAFQYTNSNFSELYTAVGPSGNNITVPGNATITGDLTVNGVNGITVTNGKFATNASGQTVGLQLDSFVSGAAFNNYILNNASAAGTVSALNFGRLTSLLYGFIRTNNNSQNLQLGTSGSGSVEFFQNNSTAMTLNSTGLGVGGSPAAKLSVVGGNIRLDNNQGLEWGGANNYIYGSEATDFIALVTNGVEALRINNSQNIGIGVTPSAWNTNYKGLVVGGSGGNGITIAGNDASIGTGYYLSGVGTYARDNGSATASSINMYNRAFVFRTAAAGAVNSAITWTDAMTLTAGGNLLVGNSTGDVGRLFVRRDSLTDQVVQIQNEAATGKMITFHTNGMNEVGSISYGISTVAYNTSSDYRLKESVKPISGGLARVNALKPSAYKWKIDGSNGEGFIAHELAETVPFAVTGEKDAVDANGKPTYQGVDLSKIVPILVAAIQELTAEVNALKNA